MPDGEHGFDERGAREFFTKRHEDLGKEFAARSEGFDWNDERSIFDAIGDAVPEGLPREIPEEVRKHFRTAQSELLVGFRGLLDAWIAQLDKDPPARKAAARRVPVKAVKDIL
jgi:hypothetical protein